MTGLSRWFFSPSDPRAYAGLRIGYSIAALYVLFDLWRLRSTLLSRSGMLGGASRDHGLGPNLFVYVESDLGVTVVFVLAMAAIVCLGLGVWQRAAALGVYLWIVSYSATVPEVLGGFDTVLRTVGFVLVISPAAPVWRLGKSELEPVPAYGLRLVQCQLALIYVCTVWLKAPDPFWRSGDAVPYFLMSMFARFPRLPWYELPSIGNALTYSTLLIEATLPLLLWMRKTRWAGLILGTSLHVAIAAGSRLTAFTLCMLPLYFAFLETHDFERARELFRRYRGKHSSHARRDGSTVGFS